MSSSTMVKTTNPVFVVQANVPGIDAEAMERECKQRQLQIQFLKPFTGNIPPHDLAGCESIQYNAHVVFFGSHVTMTHIQNHRNWTSNRWCPFEKFDCAIYYSHFGKWLTNHQSVFIPISEAIRNQDYLIDRIGLDDKVFIRPTAADKSFTGCVVEDDDLLSLLKPHCFNPERMILMSSPKQIVAEWRLIIANSQIITGCQYRQNDIDDVQPGLPDEVHAFAQSVLREVQWRPFSLFVLDIARTKSPDGNSSLGVMEINPFNCAGLLKCDIGKVIDAGVEQAKSNW
jgi:hypothetical protein